MDIPMRRELPNGRVLELQKFQQDIEPVFYITNNHDAVDTTSTDEVWLGGNPESPNHSRRRRNRRHQITR